MRLKRNYIIVAVLATALAVLAGCSEFEHGSVRGTLVNAADGQPIVGATVHIDGETGVTDATGLFGIFGIDTGDRDLTVTATGYVLPDEVIRVHIFKGVAELGIIGMVPANDMPPAAPPAL